MSVYLGTQKVQVYLGTAAKRVFAGRPDYLILRGKLVWADPKIYLQSDGTAYVDTGIVPDNQTGLKVVCSVPPYNGTDNIVVGTRETTGNTRFWIDLDWTDSKVHFGFNNYLSGSFSTLNMQRGKYYQTSLNWLNDRKGIANGVQVRDVSNITLSAQTKNIYVFKPNYSSLSAPYYGKVKSVSISQGDQEVRRFVPVPAGLVIGSTTISANCLFDIVTQTPYYNAGGGNFTYGKEN